MNESNDDDQEFSVAQRRETDDGCPNCGSHIQTVERRGPGDVIVSPCGCEVGDTLAADFPRGSSRAVADGGLDAYRSDNCDRAGLDDETLTLTYGGRDTVAADDLLVSDTVVGTTHAFRADEPRAACGHRRTRRNYASVDVKPAPDDAWNTIECRNCKRALAPYYRSTDDDWETVRALEPDDVVHVYDDAGDCFEAIVTSAADDLDSDHRGTLYVSLTTAPDVVSYQRDLGDDQNLRATEGHATTIQVRDLLDDMSENRERDVQALEVVGTHDYHADEDPDAREALQHAAEQVAAYHDRMADGTNSTEERLWNVNYATVLRDVAYRLRDDEWPVAWVRQKAESKADAYDGHPEEILNSGPLSEVRDKHAKARGKAAGYEQALALLDQYAPVDGTDDDQDDDQEDQLRADGGYTDVDELSVEELREEYQDVTSKINYRGPDTDSDEWERHLELWAALEKRADVDIPECSSCGAEKWRFRMGNPASCAECGQHPGTPEKAEAVQQAAQALQFGSTEADA